MRGRSLRRRLTGAFAVLAATCVLVTGIALSRFVEQAVWSRLDAGLEEEAELLVDMAAAEPDRLAVRAAEFAAEADHGPGKFVRIVTADGQVLAFGARAPDPGASAAAPAGTVWAHDVPRRMVGLPLPGGGSVEVGVTVHEQVHLLARARAAVAVGLTALFLVLVLLAWSITTRSTVELGRVAAELETIEAGSLDRRLPSRRTSEVDRLVEVLNRLLARLQVAVEHLRRFTADAAHELRTPIAALRAHLEVTLARSATDAPEREGLLDALEQAERLGRLAETLLTMSAVEAGALPSDAPPVALDAVVRDVADALEPVAQEEERPFVVRVQGPVAVRGSAELLTRVVLNLVDNAFRHTPARTPVEVVLWQADGEARLDVHDAGPGITSEEQQRAFRRFHRGPGGGGGAGLGLALCREIVVRHGGEITLRSAAGAGTTVSVRLPALPPAA